MALHLWSVYSTGQTGQLWFCQPGSRAPTHLSHGCSPAYPHYDSITIHQKYPCVCCVRVFVFMYKKINASIDRFILVITSSHRSLSLSLFPCPTFRSTLNCTKWNRAWLCCNCASCLFLIKSNVIFLGQLFNLGASRLFFFCCETLKSIPEQSQTIISIFLSKHSFNFAPAQGESSSGTMRDSVLLKSTSVGQRVTDPARLHQSYLISSWAVLKSNLLALQCVLYNCEICKWGSDVSWGNYCRSGRKELDLCSVLY